MKAAGKLRDEGIGQRRVFLHDLGEDEHDLRGIFGRDLEHLLDPVLGPFPLPAGGHYV